MDMRPQIDFRLRQGRRDDIAFAERVHIDAMRPLMVQLGCWNEAERRAAFRRSYKTSEVTVILFEENDIGWMQVNERDLDYNLAQIQIVEAYCGRGIGSRLITALLDKARFDGKSVSLSAVRTNRAIGLYRRLGFRMIDPDAMPIVDLVWEPNSGAAACGPPDGGGAAQRKRRR